MNRIALCCVALMASAVAHAADIADSTGPARARKVFDAKNYVPPIPEGYTERAVVQNLGPYFVVSGLAYPDTDQLTVIDVEATEQITNCQPGDGGCSSSWISARRAAISYCANKFDGRTLKIPDTTHTQDGVSLGFARGTGYLGGMNSSPYNVSGVTQVVCAQMGTRTVTTLVKEDTVSAGTVVLTSPLWESLRRGLGVDVIGVSAANQVCVWAGYPRGMVNDTTVDGGAWATCSDNTVGIYNGAWRRVSACTDNTKLRQVTCYQ